MPDVRLIDANALLQECKKAYKFEDRRGQLAHCISAIKAAPTIDAQPVKHGKWIKIDSESFHCSECDAGLSGICVSEKYISREKFCYNCGAKMDGGDDDVGQNANDR